MDRTYYPDTGVLSGCSADSARWEDMMKKIFDSLLEMTLVFGAFVLAYGLVIAQMLRWFMQYSVNPVVAGLCALALRFLFATTVALDRAENVQGVIGRIALRALLALGFAFIAFNLTTL